MSLLFPLSPREMGLKYNLSEEAKSDIRDALLFQAVSSAFLMVIVIKVMTLVI